MGRLCLRIPLPIQAADSRRNCVKLLLPTGWSQKYTEGKIMKVECVYGKARRTVFAEFYGRKILLLFLAAAFCICLIVNLAVGGTPWSGIVGISLILPFVTIDRPLLENTFLNRLQRIFLWVGVLLVYIALFYDESVWQALPIVLSSAVIFIDLLLLIVSSRRTKKYIAPFFCAVCRCRFGGGTGRKQSND